MTDNTDASDTQPLEYLVRGIAYKQGDKPSGGMGVVAKASGAQTLFGVHPKTMSAEQFNRNRLYLNGTTYISNEKKDGQEFEIINFDVPESAQKQHYAFSNEVIWPVAHSMKINTTLTVEELQDLYTGYQYYNDMQNKALINYAEGNLYDEFGRPVEREPLTRKDQIWVHDYQSINVPGSIFSWHIPFPTLDQLESVTLDRQTPQNEEEKAAVAAFEQKVLDETGVAYKDLSESKKSKFDFPLKAHLVDTPFFADYIGSMHHPLKTFQRAQDQVNVMMAMMYYDRPDASMLAKMEQQPNKYSEKDKKPYLGFAANNPQLFAQGKPLYGLEIDNPQDRQKIQDHLTEVVKMGELNSYTFQGQNSSMLSVPVGVDVKQALEAAKSRHSEEREFKTILNKDRVFKAAVGEKDDGELVLYDKHGKNFTPLVPEEYQDKDLTLDDLTETIKDRDWVLGIHRNDYTKGSEEIVKAADAYFRADVNRAKDKTFLFVLQPTRTGINGYEQYANRVLRKIDSIKDHLLKKGISQADVDKAIVVVPQGIDRSDVMRLMRRDETKVYMAPSFKDGYALMPTEFVAANSDKDVAKGVISSVGSGNSDVLWNGENDNARLGAHVVNMPEAADKGQLNDSEIEGRIVNEALAGLEFILNPENADKVKADFDFMKGQIGGKEGVQGYDADFFNNTIQSNYEKAMDHADPKWRDKSHNLIQRLGREEEIAPENSPTPTPFTTGGYVKAYVKSTTAPNLRVR